MWLSTIASRCEMDGCVWGGEKACSCRRSGAGLVYVWLCEELVASMRQPCFLAGCRQQRKLSQWQHLFWGTGGTQC